MNKYEKAAVFFFRIVGVALAAVGMMALLYLAGFLVAGNANAFPMERRVGSVIWTVFGVLLFVLAKPLGRAIGKGLE